jgi:hypothetical protein
MNRVTKPNNEKSRLGIAGKEGIHDEFNCITKPKTKQAYQRPG